MYNNIIIVPCIKKKEIKRKNKLINKQKEEKFNSK